jgi:tetratricopeptide (TPR) repeat protein
MTKDESCFHAALGTMKDRDLAKLLLLDFHVGRKEYPEALELAEQVSKNPRYAAEAYRRKAEVLELCEEWAKAIGAWRQVDNPPETLYRIADCFWKQNKLSEAVAQLREIEDFFKDQSSSAAYKVAHLYRTAREQKQYIAQLRYLMKKYPKSKESSAAHQELEKAGVKIGGGVDEQ